MSLRRVWASQRLTDGLVVDWDFAVCFQSTKAFKDIDVPEGRINIADVSKGDSAELDEAFKGISALIICTSAQPKMVSSPKVQFS